MKHCYLLLIGLLPIAFIVAAPEGKLKGQGAGQGGQVEPAEVPGTRNRCLTLALDTARVAALGPD